MKHPVYSFAIALLLSLSCTGAFALLAKEVEVAPGQTVDLVWMSTSAPFLSRQ